MTSDANKAKISDEAAYIEEMGRRGGAEDDGDLRERFIIHGKNSQRFDHNEFSKWLLNESKQYFITLEDSGNIYYYEDGIYMAGGDAMIAKMLEHIMDGHLVTVNTRREVLGHVRAMTTVKREAFDNDNDVIIMRNGTYHMSTGEITPHNPAYLSFRKIDILYDPEATCPTIDKFVNEVAEPQRVEAIYEMMGYALLPNKRLKKAIILVGPSDSGKSTTMNLLEHFIGKDYVVDINPIVLATYAHASFRLYGMLVNRIDDLGETPITETGLLKTIISSASIEANQKGGAQFSFEPNVLIIFGCNTVPMCSDPYLMDKFDIFQFLSTREGDSVNRNLIDEMCTDQELSGLFNKAMAGLKVVIGNDGFTGAYTLDDRRKEYEYLSNPIARFVSECCDTSDNEAEMAKKIFRKAYVEWSKTNCLRVVTVGEQTTYLQDNGVMLRSLGAREDRDWYYVGIQLSPVCDSVCKSGNDSNPLEIAPCVGVSRVVGASRKNTSIEGTMGQTPTHEAKNDPPIVETDLHTDLHTERKYDDDTDSKLKHAVGKAIAKCDTMGAEIADIVACYPGSIPFGQIRNMLEERGDSLGIKERYGKWYV